MTDTFVHLRESPDMHLIDDQFFHRDLIRLFTAPEEIIPDYSGTISPCI